MDDLLIDFNTPRTVRDQYFNRVPLIPCPSVQSPLPESNNPFDLVAKAAENGPSDPFDLPSSESKQTPKLKSDTSHIWDEMKKMKDKILSTHLSSPDLISTPVKQERVSVKEEQKTEDGLLDMDMNMTRDVIARRVNSCIEKALNQSLQDIREPLPAPGRPIVRRSISAAGLGYDFPRVSPVRSSAMNSTTAGGKLNDSIFEASKDIIFREARKLSQNFKKIANSFTQKEDDDLLSLKPEWDCLDFDEEDEVGLPLLNRSLCRKVCDTPNGVSDVLKRFTKLRRSLDTSDITEPVKIEDTKEIKRCHSVGYLEEKQVAEKKDVLPKIEPKIPPPALVPDPRNGKLKIKKSLPDTKGPLRALVPLQKMTRKFNEKIISPLRTACSPLPKNETLKDGSFVTSVPVASSTPSRGSSSVRTPLSSRLSRRETGPASRLRSNSVASSKLNTSQDVKKAVESKAKERPRTAPSPKVRALTDIPQSAPRNTRPYKPLLPSKLGRTGRGSLSGKENQIVS